MLRNSQAWVIIESNLCRTGCNSLHSITVATITLLDENTRPFVCVICKYLTDLVDENVTCLLLSVVKL